MTKEPRKQLTLSDMIMSKIKLSNTPINHEQDLDQPIPKGLNPKVVQVYTKYYTLL